MAFILNSDTSCGIIFILESQCLWIIKILLVRWDLISWVLVYVIKHNLYTLVSIRGDVNLWVRVTHEINEHRSPKNNNDSTAIHISVSPKSMTISTCTSHVQVYIIFASLKWRHVNEWNSLHDCCPKRFDPRQYKTLGLSLTTLG